MNFFKARIILLFAAVVLLLGPGCSRFLSNSFQEEFVESDETYQRALTQIEYPNVEDIDEGDTIGTQMPATVSSPGTPEYWDLSLQEAVKMALQSSKVLGDVGGVALNTPAGVHTKYDAAITEADPRYGVPGALSAYDTTLSASTYFEKNDKALNNVFFGGGTRLLRQDAMVVQAQLTKRAMTGTEFTLRDYIDYDANNSPGNQFPHAYQNNIEMEFRHPLMQGGGISFNQIAGPSGTPGVINGVIIARINTDISLGEFEIAVRDMVSDVENAYWDLYFGYRDLDAKIMARDSALETWRRIHALYVNGRRGGEAEKEAQAREQYFRYQAEVENALSGRLLNGTHTNNGSQGGTFQSNHGVYIAERRLRMLMGLPINDGRLIRPADEPSLAKVEFNWEETLVESLERRPEIRRQRWQIKKRELELEANKNFLKPELDLIGRYRWRGFGKNFLAEGSNVGEFDGALNSLFDGNLQEWQMGIELSVPLGKRQAHAAMRQAELMLARDRAILHEQERAIVQSLSNAISDVDRAYAVLQTTFNRRHAARQEVAAVEAAYESDNATLDLLLEAQRRQAEADGSYYRSLVEYSLAIKNVQFEKGSLLAYNNIYLAEGGWPEKAYMDAAERERLRGHVRKIADAPEYTGALSQGVYPQLLTPGEVPTEPMQPTPQTVEPTPEPVTDNFTPPPVPGVTQGTSGNPEFIQAIDFDEGPGAEKSIQNLEGTVRENESEVYFTPQSMVPPGPESGLQPNASAAGSSALTATEPQEGAVRLPTQNQPEAGVPLSVVPDTTPTLRSARQNQTLKFPLKEHSGSQDPFKNYRNAGPRWEPVPIPEAKQRNLNDFSGEVKRFPLKESN
ncbi:TolC family protein [Gimesia maris]|uniref:Outer membrane efflux protein n=1 Tax=Gimesia maris TaxID=122 RepID=A0ABX5YVV8_9PLAN|nr:TolC family protein [Gimesia maris]QDU17734.1 Outer membrane efflux protein [Gimesia maris]QEG19760.1 Outer membrane efflux protein [Gimesia maris]QGQ27416.1 TolC family protein [Gimesia maris]